MFRMARIRPSRLLIPGLLGLLWMSGPGTVQAQDLTMVTVDESPTALLLVQRVIDQAGDNVGEAARGCQELLVTYGDRLVPVSAEEPDRFVTVRRRVESLLLADPTLLERYRSIEEPVAARGLAAGEHARVVERGRLTPSGLEASLVLAQHALESGHLGRTAALLDEMNGHPDLAGREAVHRAYLRGLVAHLRAEATMLEAMRRELERSEDGVRLLQRLDRLVGTMAPFAEAEIGVLDPHRIEPPTSDGWHQVWSDDLDTSAFTVAEEARNALRGNARRNFTDLRETATLLSASPLVLEDTVLVSDGITVSSHDRFGAEDGWRTSIGSAPERRAAMVTDLSELAVDGDRLYALSGHGLTTARTDAGGVHALDVATGEVLWNVRLDGLRVSPPEAGDDRLVPDLDLEGAFPYGGVRVLDGTVVVLARKVNSRRETVLYAIGLDAFDGSSRWIRLLGSSGGVRTQRGFSRVLALEDTLVVASPVGVLARLDPATGEPRWLRRFPVPLSDSSFNAPWEIGQPAVAGNDLYAMNPDGRSVLRLDLRTGELRDEWPTGPGTTWGSVRYLVGDEQADGGPTIYAVGDDVVAMDARTPGVPRWRLSETARDELNTRSATTSRSGTRGRVHAAGSRLVVPGIDDLLIVDAADGRVAEVVAFDGPANPVLLESQLVLGGLDRVDSLMQLGPAESLLRRRIADAPEDASRPLSLLELGLQADELGLALEAADMVAERLADEDTDEAVRENLIGMLLRLQALAAENPDLARTAVGRAATVARTPSQRARVLLADGDLLAAADRPQEAITTWLELGAEPALASVEVTTVDRSRQAGLLLRERLERLEAPAFRTRLDALAEAAFESTDPGDPEALETLARRFPGTGFAVEARRRAARLLEARGDALAAGDAMRTAVFDSPRDAPLRLEAAELLRDSGAPDGADALLLRGLEDRALRTGLLAASKDREDLLSLSDAGRPGLGPVPGIVIELPGELVETSGAGSTPGGLLTLEDRTLVFRESPAAREPAWTIELDTRDPQVLDLDDTSLLLWSPVATGTGRCLRLSLEDGGLLWSSPSVDELLPQLPEIAGGRGTRQGMMPGGGVFRGSDVVPVLDDERLVLVRRAGDVVAIDPDGTDDEPLWKARTGLDRIHEVHATDRRLILVGRERLLEVSGMSPVERSKVVVLDSGTGRLLNSFRPTGGRPVRWASVDPRGLLLLGTQEGVEAFELAGGEAPLWTNRSPDAASTVSGTLFGDRLVATLPEGALLALDPRDGSVRPGAFAVSDSADWDSSGLVATETDVDGLMALFDRRLVRFDDEGAVIGMDAVDAPNAYSAVVSARDRVFVVDELMRNLRNGSYNYLVHRLDPGRGLRIAEPSLEVNLASRLERITLLDGWMLLSSGTMILAIPMTDEIPAPNSVPGV